MDSPALTLSQAHESTRLVCHARFVLSEISVHYWEHYPQRPWHISVAGLSLCISTDDSLASPAYTPKSASIGTIISRINTPDTLCFLHILRLDLNSHSASKWQLHMLPRYIHVRPSHARLRICTYYDPRSAPGECRPVMVDCYFRLPHFWLANLFTRCIEAMFIHATAVIPIYQSNYFRMGMMISGLAGQDAAHIPVIQWRGVMDLHSGQGWKRSFLFQFHWDTKEYWHWCVGLWTSQDWVSIIAPAWTHHSCMLAIDLLL